MSVYFELYIFIIYRAILTILELMYKLLTIKYYVITINFLMSIM